MGSKSKGNLHGQSVLSKKECDFQDLARIGGWELTAGQKYLTVTHGLCKLLGLEPCVSLPLEKFTSFFASSDGHQFDEHIKSCFSQAGNFAEDFELTTKLGDKLWVAVQGNSICDENGKVVKILGYLQDINETKLQLLKMEEERNLLKLAIDISRLGIWSSDDQNNINFDDRMREIYGFLPGEKETVEAVQAKIHEDDKDDLNALSEESAVKKVPVRFQYRVYHDKANIRYIEGYLLPQYDPITDKFKNFIGVNKDITDQVKGDESNKRLLEILDSTTDFVSHASLDKEIKYVNRAFKELLQKDHEGSSIESVHPEWANKLIQEVGVPTAIKNGNWIGETAVLTAQGQEIPVSQVIVCHYNSKKEPKYFSTIMRDMRETKKMLATLQDQKKGLEAAARSKANFLANMSHEIRTPMNGILGFVDLLRDETKDPGACEKLEVIQSSGELLLSIVDDILDFSKIEAGHISLKSEEFDPMNIILGVKKLFESKRIKNTNSIELVDSGLAKVVFIGDQNRFKQLLFNLVGNACKFTSNGKVTIKISSQVIDKKTHNLKINISDTGIGISEDRIGHLFKSFSQADESTTRRFGGTGLGLSICKSILDAWQGSITVESKLGKGSSFDIQIPLATTNKVSGIKSAKNDKIFPGLKVLIAEDNLVNLKVTQKLLSKLGVDAKSAPDGQQAVQACSNEQFHLVLMDCHMPVMDGFEAARKISEQAHIGKTPPLIIALTAGVMEEEVKRCKDSGMVDVLFKPVTLKQLAEMIAKHIPEHAKSKTVA